MTEMNTAPQLAPRERCTGCAACCNGCPKGAIRMVPDREGFLYPQVTDGCVQCGHCTHICPVLKQREPRTEPAAFIVWNGDEAVRRNSTAGGAFSALAEYVLEGGGVVFGAALDGDLRVKFQPGDMIDINGVAYEVFLLDDGTAAVPEVPEADRYEAVFPSVCNFLQQTKESPNFKLPLAQFHAGPGTFGRNAMPMYGEATGIDEEKGYVNIRLHNMCGVLKLTLKGSATINSILVKDRSGAPISGYATLGTDNGGSKILSTSCCPSASIPRG